ncbi:MAG: DUF4388 domain-containing protein [Chitinivibrionales bacterium]|nr:DUF4388 domain-containing protein [Chitinivibrionales bacterium]
MSLVAPMGFIQSFLIEIAAFAGGIGIAVMILFLKNRTRSNLADIQETHTTFVFSGNLKQTSLLDAIQFLEIGRRQGILHIYCGRRKGYLTFADGKVIDAFYRNTTGREAIFAMLDLEEGDFYFEPKMIMQPQLMQESILDLTFEWDARKNS